jgi:PAS domain S-box-containing protein
VQFVNAKLYSAYNVFATIIGIVLLVGVATAWLVPGLSELRAYGLSPVTGVIAGFQVFYGLFLFNRRRAYSPFTAGLLANMILVINVINLINSTGGFHSPVIAFWAIIVLLGGMFGMYSSVTFGFLITIYFVMLQNDPEALSQGRFDPIAIAGVFGTYLLAFISYQIWSRFYIDRESAMVKDLSGQLKSTQQKAEVIVQSIEDAVIATDNQGQITLFNPAAEKMTGWPVAEASGIDVALVAKFQQENGQALAENGNPFKQAISTGKPVSTTMRVIRRDTSFLIASVVVTPITDDKGKQIKGAAAVLRDVSQAKAEEHRRADFISTASHEMRTPVAAIEGYLQLALNEKVSKVDAKARNFLVKALDSTHNLGKLFQDLLTSAKAEDGRLVSHPVVIEMGDYLKEISDGLRFSAEKKGLLLDFKIGASQAKQGGVGSNKMIRPLYYSYADPDRLREVITNLFDNAVKYTDKGKITVALTGNDDVVQIFIRDTGPGIPKDDLPHLFQKFYRVDNSATRTVGGTGLGLFICKQIVDLYNGRIWVESEVGQGSTFFINLPRLSSQKATDLQQQAAASATNLPNAT